MKRYHATTLAALMGLGAGAAASAQEWTRFRGPNGSGVSASADVPATWGAKDVIWKTALPGTGHSSPVLWGKKIFLTATEKETAKRIVLCIDEGDGKVLWEREYDSVRYRQHNDNSYASSSAAADGERVYLAWSTPEEYSLRALDHEGKDVWKVGLGPYVSQHGSGTSPIVYKDLVILTNDQEGRESFVVAVEKATGKVKWKTTRKPGSMTSATPCVVSVGGKDQIVVTSRTEGMAALDPETGKVLWQVADAFPLRVVASPAVFGDILINQCGEGGVGKHLIAVKAPAAGGTPEVAWKKTQAQHPPYVPSPVVKGDLCFTWSDKGVVTCVKAATGEQVWQEKVGGEFFSSPVIVGEKLICVGKKGEVVMLRAGDRFELLGKTELGDQCYATPAVANGKVYVRTTGQLICVGGKGAIARN